MKSFFKKLINHWWGKIIIFFLFILFIFSIAFIFNVINHIKNLPKNNYLPPKPVSEEKIQLIEGINNNWTGSESPKITIVQFADYACPYCYNSFTKIREISHKYKNDIKIIFRDYPSVSEYSVNLALGVRCAGEQGLFLAMYDNLFINQGVKTTKEISKLAIQSGVDINRFNTCFKSRKYIPSIAKDLEDGNKLGITGTPTWFINGHPIGGDIPYNIFIEIIEKLLNNQI